MKRIIILTITCLFVGFTLQAQSVTYSCRYWFDQDYAQVVTATFCESSWQAELDVGLLDEGFHTLFLQICDTSMVWNRPQAYMFYKVDTPSDINYHCWFDQDIEHRQTDSIGDGHLMLDVTDLSDGLHTVNVMLEGNAPKSYMFMKVAVQDFTNVQYRCWFDNDYSTIQTGLVGTGVFEIEVDGLSNGLHTVYVQLDNGTSSVPQAYMFYKRPVGGCIIKWEYWLNGDSENRHTTNLSPFVDTLDIIALLPLESWPIRSTCFHFQPNGDEPYLNAKNEITFYFWDAEYHVIDKSIFYVDENVSEPVVADTLERNTTITITAPRDNQIRWFKLEANRGEYLSFQADKACTMQLFAPSGEEVYAALGPESIQEIGFNVWEDGTYYLAVHDVTGSGEEVSVTYNWLNRYAVVSHNVHLVGNGGCSTITFQGNGFNSLLDVYLVNYQNDTIRQLDIGHESNTTTTVSFNFYQENLGAYDAVFEFFEETIRINGALEVQEPVDIYLTSTVSYPSSFMSGSTVTFNFTITNNGNMSAYVMPVYLYVSSPTKESITHLEIDGLELPSIIDDIDMDSLSASDRMWLQEWAEDLGDDHYFFKTVGIDETTGDSIYIRSNYFFVDIAPFETKSIKLKITATTGAHQPIEAWMTIPNDLYSPLILTPEGGYRGSNRGWYCCMQEQIQCTLNLICSSISIASIVPAWAAPLAVADCICGIINEINDVYSSVFCDGNSNLSYWERFKNMKKAVSVTGTVVACIKRNNPVGKIKEILDAIDAVVNGLTLGDITHDVSDCINKWKRVNPNCLPGPPKGGGPQGLTPGDPNDIFGYLSESGSHYMRQEIQNVQYEIEFENDTTLATAAAHTIIVRDTLDATKFDLNSLAARSVTIGDKRLELNGEQTFARTLDLRPDIYVIAQVEQDYDPVTGIIQWTIQSLDPMTMEPTNDPNQGVLPVNYYGNGVGFIDYSINLKEAFADGTEISNRAGITFDQEDQILTPTWTNIVDAVKPTSHIENVVPVADSLSFSFVSEDNRSGVWYHALYYRNDSTYQEWQVRKAQIFENSYTLHLDDLQTTEYLVMAVDSAGNHEDKLMNAEYVFSLDSIVYYTLAVESQGCGEVSGAGTYLAGSHVVIEAIPDSGCQFDQWNDGITDNPRTVELVQDTTFVAQFSFDPSDITQSTGFVAGWNWWSSYIELSDNSLEALQNGLGTSGMMIKSQNDGYASYLAGYGWYGSLSSIYNESTYQIRASQACTVEMTGSVANPTAHPITLNSGWTWVGYPVNANLSVTDALSGITSQTNDMLKSQNDGFASYLEGFGWYGSLNLLHPGMGLMYKSNNSSNITLTYPNSGTRTDLRANQTTENNHWRPNLNAYPDNMSVMAVVELDGEELQGEQYELAVFAGGECRGSARLLYVEPINRYMAFLTVAGDEAAELYFALYNTETGEVETQCITSLLYETNAVIGSFDEPYIVRFRHNTGLDEWDNFVNLFPNPVARGQRVSLGLPAEETSEVRVEIINALGAIVETRRATSLQTITAPSTPGVYTLRISVEGKGTCYRKLVVE